MLLKGTKIGVDGQLTNRPYTAKDGTEKLNLELRVNEVTLLGAKSDAPVQKSVNVAVEPDDLESDIPFN